MSSCNACGQNSLHLLLDLGPIPIAHRFLKEPAGPREFRHPMRLHLCDDCGLLQIIDPIAPAELYKGFNFCFTAWKPQPHMQQEASLIGTLVGPGDLVVEVGSNDGGFLHELEKAGLTNIVGVEPNNVANQRARKTGAVVYEGFFGKDLVQSIRAEKGPAALIVSRQVVEHIPALRELAESFRSLLRPGGYLLLEVPDFESPMTYGDVSCLWEEHVNYFTEDVLKAFLSAQGFKTISVARYDFSGGALMVLAQLGEEQQIDRREGIERAKRTTRAFPDRMATFKEKLLRRLEAGKASGRPSALYGTGCRANMLLNAFKIQGLIDLVVDDQPEKQGLYMPGSALRVEPSSALSSWAGDCYLCVNAENEEKVIARQSQFTGLGGNFISVNSPSSRLAALDASPAPVS